MRKVRRISWRGIVVQMMLTALFMLAVTLPTNAEPARPPIDLTFEGDHAP